MYCVKGNLFIVNLVMLMISIDCIMSILVYTKNSGQVWVSRATLRVPYKLAKDKDTGWVILKFFVRSLWKEGLMESLSKTILYLTNPKNRSVRITYIINELSVNYELPT